jgi:hypothetical protein
LLDPPLEPPSKKNDAIYIPQTRTPNSSYTPPPSLVGPTRRRRRSWQEMREMRETSCTNTPPSWHFVFLLSGSNQQQKGRVAEGFFFFFFNFNIILLFY